MPAYNPGAFLREAIDSVRSQSFSNWELIIVDDASSDTTHSICEHYQRIDRRIKVIKNSSRRGIAKSRNQAVQLSVGSYLALQDSDDFSHPLRFSKQLAFLRHHYQYGLIGTQAYQVDIHSHHQRTMDKPAASELIYHLSPLDNCFVNGSIMMKRSVYNHVGGYNEHLHYKTGLEDYYFNFLVSQHTKTTNLPERLYYHRFNPFSTIQSNFRYYTTEANHLRKRIARELKSQHTLIQPAVSVIIPNYNYSKYLSQSIESVINQTHRPIDLIIIDDCSNDSSGALVSKYQRHHSFIRLIRHRKHQGLSAARNTGIKHSFGTYLAFLDSDDWWEPDKLTLQLNKISSTGVGIVYSHTHTYDQETHRIIGLDKAYLKGKVFNELLEGNRLKGSASGVLVKKDLFHQSGNFRTILPAVEDWDLWLRLTAITKVDFVSKPLVTIRTHSKSVQTNQLKMIICTLIVNLLIPYYIVKYKQIVTRDTVRYYLRGWYRFLYLSQVFFSSPIW